MKRTYTLLQAISVMLLMVWLFTACSKSTATPDNQGTEKKYTVYSFDSTSIGSIVISKEQEGNAKIVLSIDRAALVNHQPPFQPMLISSTLPTAALQPINPETGISETYPVLSSNKGLTVSYDALMYMRDLRLMISDGSYNAIAVTDIH